jgi:hypothetical protein
MPKPIKFNYQKKDPFRDAFHFIIVCEGQSREPEYFKFFDGLSSRVKIVAVSSMDGKSSPEKLIDNALAKEIELGTNEMVDQVWFVIDTDRWRNQIRNLRDACSKRTHWFVVQSNPCFEVWLYYHAKSQLPDLVNIERCDNWKPHLPQVIKGGFNSEVHPIVIESATKNAKMNYRFKGYEPEPGSTQLWQLAEAMIPVIKKDLHIIKHLFPMPDNIDNKLAS